MTSDLRGSQSPQRLVFIVGLTIGLSILGDSYLYGNLPIEAENLGIALPLVGVLLSANRLVRLVSNTWASSLFERWGPRKPFLAATVLALITTSLYGVGWGFAVFLLARMGWGIAWSALRQGGYQAVWAAGQHGKGRMMGLLWGMIRLGSAVSVVFGGYLRDLWGYRAGVLGILCLSALAVPAAASIGWPAEAQRVSPSKQSFWEGWRETLKSERGRRLLLAASLNSLFEGILIATASLFLARRLGTFDFLSGLGIRIGAINPNVFQDPCYARGSLGNPDVAVRAKAVAHMRDCIAIATATGSECISLWFADGTNYPGQDDFRARKRRFEDGLREVYAALAPNQRLLVEYKCFEPAFYHTDLADWGTSLLMCQKIGPQAQVLVDTGHHLPGANIEHIVALLLDEGRLGGFHFNGRKYADDDLTLGSINPYELFLIFCETVKGALATDARVKTCSEKIAYMFDHSLVDKPKIAATIQSVMIAQEAYAKALLVDQKALAAAQVRGDIVGAEEVLKDAFATDVRPLLAQVRTKLGVPENPLQAWRASGGEAKRASEREARHGKAKAGGGFQ